MATRRSADSRATYRVSTMLSVAHACFERKRKKTERERKREREREKSRPTQWTRLFVVIAIVGRAREADTSTRATLCLRKPPRATKQYKKRQPLLVLPIFSGTVTDFCLNKIPPRYHFLSLY
ncbi:hypothetical protein ACS0PU_005429 [Formica fusca]